MFMGFNTAMSHVQQAARGNYRDLGKLLRALVEGTINTVVNVTASTATLRTAQHSGKVITVNRAAGSALVLPAASGSGGRHTFVIGTTITSNSTTIKAASASDSFIGNALVAADGGNSALAFEVAAGDDTVTLNGSTTGGIKGDVIEFVDVAVGEWLVRAVLSATGTEATPFSATVS